jgi:hypothetical protein
MPKTRTCDPCVSTAEEEPRLDGRKVWSRKRLTLVKPSLLIGFEN